MDIQDKLLALYDEQIRLNHLPDTEENHAKRMNIFWEINKLEKELWKN